MNKLSLSALLFASIVTIAPAEDAAKRPDAKPARAERGEAAERRRDRDNDSKSEVSDADQKQNLNQTLASCIAIGNQHEIAMTQFAMAHIEHPEVKKFAQMLHDDHTQLATKLAKFASEEANMKFGEGHDDAHRESSQTDRQADPKTAQVEAKDKAATADRVTVTAAHSGAWNQNRMVTVERQVAQKCLTMTEKELTEAKSRGQFDQAFLGCQIGGHIGMVAKLSVFEKEADGELAHFFSKGTATTEKHLAQAKQLMTALTEESKNKTAKTANDK